MEQAGALAGALARALAGHGPLPAPPLPPPGSEVAVVIPPDLEVALGLAPLLDRLAMGGVHRGRLELVVAAPDGTPASREWVAALGARLGVRVHRHDPAHARTFPLRLAGGGVVGVDDALRECEALVLAARVAPGAGLDPLAALLTPGLADPSTRAACGRARADGRGWGVPAAEAIGIELAIAFVGAGAGTRALAGAPALVQVALAAPS
jgi:hypothetical protein